MINYKFIYFLRLSSIKELIESNNSFSYKLIRFADESLFRTLCWTWENCSIKVKLASIISFSFISNFFIVFAAIILATIHPLLFAISIIFFLHLISFKLWIALLFEIKNSIPERIEYSSLAYVLFESKFNLISPNTFCWLLIRASLTLSKNYYLLLFWSSFVSRSFILLSISPIFLNIPVSFWLKSFRYLVISVLLPLPDKSWINVKYFFDFSGQD